MISKEMFISFDGNLSSEESQDIVNYEALFDLRDRVRGYVRSHDPAHWLIDDDCLSDSIIEMITFYKYAILEYFDKSVLASGVETEHSSSRKSRNII